MYICMAMWQFKGANELQDTPMSSVASARTFFPAPKCTNECFHKIRLPSASECIYMNIYVYIAIQTYICTFVYIVMYMYICNVMHKLWICPHLYLLLGHSAVTVFAHLYTYISMYVCTCPRLQRNFMQVFDLWRLQFKQVHSAYFWHMRLYDFQYPRQIFY